MLQDDLPSRRGERRQLADCESQESKMAALSLALEQQTEQLKKEHLGESHVGKFYPHYHHTQPDDLQKGQHWNDKQGI